MSDEILPILLSILEFELLFSQVHVQKDGKKKIFGLDCGLYYIKPQSIHWSEQYSTLVIHEDPKCFHQFFRLSTPAFQYICSLVYEKRQ